MSLPPPPEQWQALRASTVADRLSPAAHWYFADEWVALNPNRSPSTPLWLAAPQLRTGQRLLHGVAGHALQVQAADGSSAVPLTLVPALDSNPVFINAQTLSWFASQPLRLRGRHVGGGFEARTLWPESWRLPDDAPLWHGPWQALIRRGTEGAQQPFSAHLLWRRPAPPRTARWAIGFMLNGAQGDDDEAHGGHFALTLGRCRDDGDIADWLVANFYNPDVVSEKGILPALVPMDNYLADLNSGQQQYRPSWLISLLLDDDAVAAALYQQLQQTLERLYDHRLHYRHTDNNCTGLSMDALRAAGLAVPPRGPSSRLLAPLLFASTWLRERRWQAARDASRYLLTEQTRLLPWQAFVACTNHVLDLVQHKQTARTPLEQHVLDGALALYGLHLPQFPSARPWGREPATSLFDYQRRVPAKRADWKIIPVPARELPAALRRVD